MQLARECRGYQDFRFPEVKSVWIGCRAVDTMVTVRLNNDIPVADFRALVHLMGLTISLPGGLLEKRRALLDGLLLLTTSHNWIWQLREVDRAEVATLSHLADSSAIFPENDVPNGNPSAIEVLPHCLIGQRCFPSGETGRIVLLREPYALPYGPRETLIIQMILEEVPWLYRSVWNRGLSEQDSLPQRQKDVLVHLSKGCCRKEIAAMMGISAHTVSDYTKVIFATFGVHSQAELMNLFYKGTITIKQ